VPDDPKLLSFLNELENDITADVQPDAGNPADFRELSFTRIVSEELDAAGVLESPVICHYEHGRAAAAVKVSGYSLPDEDSRLDLFISHYAPRSHSEVPTVNATEVDTAFRKLERFMGRALNGLHEDVEPALPESDMTSRIFQLKGKFDRVNFFLFTNCRLAIRREKQRKPQVNGVPATFEVWDIERFRRLRESGAAYEALNVDLRTQPNGGLPCVRLDAGEGGFRTCVAIFPGSLLRDLYDEHGSRLLELNVRSYLQAKGKVNQGILTTLKKDPADFMAYNNGITVVAEGIVFEKLKDGTLGISELQGMQIVNGGQTTASIHRAAKEFDADLSQVFVQGKIVTVDPARFNEVVPQISKFANSQNKVTDPDLQATHHFHIGLERVAKREWTPDQSSKWFYERARGSYQTARTREGSTEARLRDFDKRYPTNQRFTKEDLAKFEICWRGFPQIVNRGQQKNFNQFMVFIKQELGELPEKWEPPGTDFRRYIGKAILYRDVQQIVKKNEVITAYRVNVTNYAVSLLAERTARRIDLEAIWKAQRISNALADTAKGWSQVIFKELLAFAQTQPVHIDTVLKSQECWDHMLSLDLRIPKAVERELVSGVVQNAGGSSSVDATKSADELSTDDHNNIARCRELSTEQWLDLVRWGNQSGALDSKQLGIATTLAGYAAQKWARDPSIRQAFRGVEMIEAARAAGLFKR